MDNTLDFHALHANISSRTWYLKISPLFVAFVSKTLNLDPKTRVHTENWAVAIVLAWVGLGSLLAIQPLVEQFFHGAVYHRAVFHRIFRLFRLFGQASYTLGKLDCEYVWSNLGHS